MSTLPLRGRMAELKQKRDSISVKVRALARSIESLCQLGLLSFPEDIDGDSIESLAGSLAEQRRELKETLDLIRELEKEL